MLEFLIIVFLIYFFIGCIFYGFVLLIAPKMYKKQINSQKVMEVIVFLWPLLLIQALKRIIIDK